MVVNGNLQFHTLGDAELQNAIIERLASDPTGSAGRLYYNTGTNLYRFYNGTAWADIQGVTAALVDVDGDTQIQVEEAADDDTIRMDVGESPTGFGAVADIMTIAASGWTVSMGSATTASQVGAPISLTSGGGGATAAGGDFDIMAGQGGGTSGAGGTININGGMGSDGGDLGGPIVIAGGVSTGINNGSAVTISSGAGVGADTDGGLLQILGGAGIGAAGTGGTILVSGGTSATGFGGPAGISGGGVTGGSSGAGSANIFGGSATGGTGDGGNVQIGPGASVGGASGQILISDAAGVTGSEAAPLLTFNGDTDTGMWRSAADTINFSVGGSEAIEINAAGLLVQNDLRLEDDSGTDFVGLAVPAAVTTSYTITLPAAVGTTGQVLQTVDAAGTLGFVTLSSASITDADADTLIQVEESADEDIIRFDTGATNVGFPAVPNIMTLASSGLTVTMGTADVATTVGAPVSFTAGEGNTTGVGGAVNLTAGVGGSGAGGGDIVISGGAAGTGSAADGGDIELRPGALDGAGADGTVRIIGPSAGAGEMRLEDDAGGQYIGFKAAATIGSSFTLTWPSADSTGTQALVSNGAGVLSFSDIVTTAFTSITGDTGTATADDTSDTFSLVGATNGGIVTVASDGPESVTFAMELNDLAALGAAPAVGDLIAIADIDDSNTNKNITVTQLAAAIQGATTLDDLFDVDDATGHTASTAYLFQGDGTNLDVVDFSTVAADTNFVEAVQDIVGDQLFTNGSHTSITAAYDDAGDGAIDLSVDDVFLFNTGDNLTAGTLTIDSGASIAIATGGDLTIADMPTAATDAANKAYVDSIASGLDPKESVQAATVSAPGGTYSAVGGTGGTGAFTAIDLTAAPFDGVTLGVGDRVLIKDVATAVQNGIYVVTTAGAAGVIERAGDHDGSPANEVSGGNFTFVEQGTTLANTGWVLTGTGNLTLNTDAITFTQFTGAGSFTAGNGLDQSGNTIFFDPDDLGAATIVLADEMPFHDIGFADLATDKGARKTTVQNFLDDLGLLTDSAGGNAITGSDGIVISTQDVQLDIGALGTGTTTVGADLLVLNDGAVSGAGATHIARTVTDFIADHSLTTQGTLTASNGVELTGADFAVSIDSLTLSNAVVGADLLIFDDGAAGTNGGRTFTNLLADLDIVNTLGGNGIAVQTAADTYTARSVAASAVAGDQGISVVNGDGIAGDMTVGLDIAGLSAAAGDPLSTDSLVVYDGTNNERVTVAQLADAISGVTSTSELTDVTAAATVEGQVLVANGSNNYTPQIVQFIYNSNGGGGTATTHTVTHNLNQQFVNVTVYDNSNAVIIPQSITLTSANEVTVVFNSAIDCKVVVIGFEGVAVTVV